jgi:hypothetical protein
MKEGTKDFFTPVIGLRNRKMHENVGNGVKKLYKIA